jgi:hypothetical protein
MASAESVPALSGEKGTQPLPALFVSMAFFVLAGASRDAAFRAECGDMQETARPLPEPPAAGLRKTGFAGFPPKK